LQANFLSERFCDKLRLYKKSVNIPASGIGETLSYIKFVIQANIRSRNGGLTFNISCLVIPKITEILPSRTIDRKALDISENIILVDPTFDQPSHIDMLIGAEYFYQLLCIDQIKQNSYFVIQLFCRRLDLIWCCPVGLIRLSQW